MRRTTFILMVMSLLLVMSPVACKKSGEIAVSVGISFISINPQVIEGGDTAFVSIIVSNLAHDQTVLVKTLVDRGLANPSITYTTGNPVYIEYFPPGLAAGSRLESLITVVVTDLSGTELDRADARVLINY